MTKRETLEALHMKDPHYPDIRLCNTFCQPITKFETSFVSLLPYIEDQEQIQIHGLNKSSPKSPS